MGSLQDALLKSGLVDADELKHARKKKTVTRGKKPRVGGAGSAGKSASGRRPAKKARTGPTDLSRAYAAKRKAELEDKEKQKQARVADQEARRKRNLELDKVVEGRMRNTDDADQPRYFEHIGRIRRVLCTPEQRDQINGGELGIVSLRGRYLIVDSETLEKYRTLAPDLVPDLSGKEPEQTEDDYPPVPDDLTW